MYNNIYMDFTELPKVIESVSQLEINDENRGKSNETTTHIINRNNKIFNTQDLNSYFETRKPKKKDYENAQWLTGC
jgi:hypothetical protein